MAKITLTMIVKNEAERLPGALASAAGAVDRIVVVDTGSSDDTIAIARAAGALVIEHPFVDFADARNAALPHVETPWMLSLDADERLAPGAGAALRAAIDAGDFDCGMLPYHTAETADATVEDVLSGAAARSEPVLIARLFRMGPGFRWEDAAHETPRTWLATPGRRFRDLDAAIVHYGGTADMIAVRGKNERNLRLLRQRVTASPRDIFGQIYLARELIRAGDSHAARAALDAAWGVVSSEPSQRAELATLATMRAWDQIQREDEQAAMKTLGAVAQWGTVHPNMFLLQGIALENLSAKLPAPHDTMALRKAVEVFGMCREFAGSRFTEEVIAGATGWSADIRQGACLLALGEADAARPCFARAIEKKPDLEEARLGLAESLLASDPDAALRVLAPIQASAGVDGWLLSAAAHEVRGALREMGRCLLEAVQHVREGFRANHRRALLDELVALLGIIQGEPRPGRGAMGTLAGLMAGYPPSAGGPHPAPAGSDNARRLGHALAFLRAGGELTLLAALAEPPAEALFPGIGVLLAEAQ